MCAAKVIFTAKILRFSSVSEKVSTTFSVFCYKEDPRKHLKTLKMFIVLTAVDCRWFTIPWTQNHNAVSAPQVTCRLYIIVCCLQNRRNRITGCGQLATCPPLHALPQVTALCSKHRLPIYNARVCLSSAVKVPLDLLVPPRRQLTCYILSS
jgi:hypothetical protein